MWLPLAQGQVSEAPAAVPPSPWEQHRIALTAREVEWLAFHPVIRVGMDLAWPPFSFINQDGRLVGIDVDMLQHLQERLGVEFQVQRHASWSATYQKLLHGELDMVTGIALSPTRQQQVRFTEPYVQFPVGIITRQDEPFLTSLRNSRGRIVASPRDYVTTEHLRRDYPDLHLIETATTEEMLTLVAGRKSDIAIVNFATASYIIKTRGLTNLKIAGITDYRFDLRFAARQDVPDLQSILNKGLASIAADLRHRVLDRWILLDITPQFVWRQVATVALAVLLAAGLIIGLIWRANRRQARELTERRRIEAALRASEDKFRRIFDNMAEAYAVCALDGRFLLVNHAMADLAGASTRQVLQQDGTLRTLCKDPAAWDTLVAQLRERGRLHNVDLALRHQQGDTLAVLGNLQMTFDAAGEPAAVECLLHDISERKRAEEALTTSLARLQTLNEEKSRFLSMVAHDLNNPIHVLLLGSDLLREELPAPSRTIARLLSQIQESGLRMERLVRNLLNLKAIEDGAAYRQITTMDVRAVVTHTVERLRGLALGKRLRVQCEVGEEPCLVRADEDATEQVLENLLSNAIKFSPPEQQIWVRLLQSETHVSLQVQDQGPGIPSSDMPRLFTQFARLSTRPTGHETSHGLGLAIVKHLADAMDATVTCESIVGQGTTFTVAFPLAQVEASIAS